MITETEKEDIINAAVEKALLLLPETVGNLMAQQSALADINKKFYAEHKEFRNHKDSVMSVVEKIEGENPLLDYKDILAKAVPEIKHRIKTMGSLDTGSVESKPPMRILEADRVNPNGVL